MKDTAIDFQALDRECSVFCRYLIGQNPNDYIRKKYRDANLSHAFDPGNPSHPFDDFLVAIAGISPWTTRMIDVYTLFFQRSSVIRKKLVLLLAILESAAPSHRYLDSVDSKIPLLFLMKCVFRSLTFVGLLLIVTVLILPFQLFVRGSVNFIAVCLARHG